MAKKSPEPPKVMSTHAGDYTRGFLDGMELAAQWHDQQGDLMEKALPYDELQRLRNHRACAKGIREKAKDYA